MKTRFLKLITFSLFAATLITIPAVKAKAANLTDDERKDKIATAHPNASDAKLATAVNNPYQTKRRHKADKFRDEHPNMTRKQVRKATRHPRANRMRYQRR